MICDKVMYKGQEILTVYHKCNDSNMKERFIRKQKKIGRYNLVFTEKYIDDTEIENIHNYCYVVKGLLPPKSEMNPFGDSACANMIHYIYENKPQSLFAFNDNHYSIKIPVDKFLEISQFIKIYTGIDVAETPMILGDIFIYESMELKLKSNINNGVVIRELPANSTIVINFKNEDTIVSTKIVKTTDDIEEIEITSDKPWKSHDIEIFNNEELIFYNKDISYLRNVTVYMSTTTKGKPVPLKKLGETYEPIKKNQIGTSQIGEPINEIEKVISESNTFIKKSIKSENPDDKVFFIKPDELDKAKKLIINTFEKAVDEIWIFDPYFTDKNGLSKIIEWLRILVNSNNSSRHIVFYSNDNALETTEFISEIKKDPELDEFIRIQKGLRITFHQVKSSIHDRFILVKNNNEYLGLSVGTSLNSLERNHYCIHKLSHSAAKIILNELIDWMNDGNVSTETEV